jgi:predicted ATPase
MTATHAPPTGTVTFLFSDIQGSTRLLQELGDGYVELLQRHNAIVRTVIKPFGGVEISTEGDSFFVVFPSAVGAVHAAAQIQRALADDAKLQRIRIRIGLHSGMGRLVGGSYVGIDVHRAARIAAAGHGGQVLISDATRALTASDLPTDVTLRDLGPHRLKDLAQAERLYQLVMHGLRSEFPALKSLDARPNNLPAQLSSFIGRQDQVSEIVNRLLNGTRLLTLTGPGGTGKTRLALEVAAELLTGFDAGVWFVDLAPITDPALVVSTIAEVLGIKEVTNLPLQDALEQQLRDRATLLVLDNFEQVVDAGAAVERLLLAAPKLKVLVTSRTVLHRHGEQEFPVPPFELPSPGVAPDLSVLTQFEAVHLFIERATAVKPDFSLTSDNAPAVAEITVRLDGLPLAIELAASRVKILSPQAILARLGAGSALLSSPVSDAPARQRTLRGAIEWSYELLHEKERQLFELMSVFQGGADLEAIEAVCAPMNSDEVLSGLASLADNSLLRQSAGQHGESRFVMLETIKEYAAGRLTDRPQLAASVRHEHAAYFAAVAERHSSRLGDPEREQALAALIADVDNLRIAWRYWVGEADVDQLNRMVDGLWFLYDARGWYHATVELTNDLLNVLSSVPSTPERSLQELTLRISLARALLTIYGYTSEVEDAYASALALFEGQQDVPQLFPVLRSLASFYNYQAEFEKGEQIGRRMLELAEAQNNPSYQVHGELVVGSSIAFQGDLRRGLDHLDTAIACFASHGSPSQRLSVSNNPGVAAHMTSALLLWFLGFPDRAHERANRGVAVAAELQHPSSLAYARFHSGFLHLWRREPDLARSRAMEVIEVARGHDLPIWTALGTCLLGAGDASCGQTERGLAGFQEGIDLYKGMKTPPVFWPLILALHAEAHSLAGRTGEGLALIDEAIGMMPTGGTYLLPEFYTIKGELLQAAPAASPETWFRQAHDSADTFGARMPQLRAAIRLCRLWRDRGEVDQAARLLRPVYDTFTEGFEMLDLRDAAELLASLE